MSTFLKKFFKKSRNKQNKIEKLKEKLEIVKIQQQFEEIQAKKANSEAKKTEKEFDGIIEKVKGYKDMMQELGIDKTDQDEFSKIMMFMDKITANGSGNQNQVVEVTPENPKSDQALLKKAKKTEQMLKGINIKEVEMMPAPLVKNKIISMIKEFQSQK